MNPDLHEAAVAEVQRLTAARALMRDGDALALARLETEGPWIGIARSKLKRRLRRGRLEIWRVAYEDGSGRVLESRLVVLAVAGAFSTARALAEAVPASEIEPVIHLATIEWRDAVARAVASFASVRLAREAAIASSAARARSAPVQTGLFDRREQHAHAILEEVRCGVSEALAERKASIECAATLVAAAPRLLLVIAGAGRS
jgi:hypothetical protein